MWCRAVLVRTNVSEKRIASIIRVTGVGGLRTTLAISSNLNTTVNVVPSSPILVTLMMRTINSFETSVLTRAARRHIPSPFFEITEFFNLLHLSIGTVVFSFTQPLT
jgi:hypothetical protein